MARRSNTNLAVLTCLLNLFTSASASVNGTGTGTGYKPCTRSGTGTAITPTGSSNSTRPSCLSTSTAHATITETTVSTSTAVTYDTISGTLINGDDFVPNICRPYTYTLTSTVTTSAAGTTTTTLTDITTFTTGSTETTTIPPPSGFTPVQDTLPGATYARRLGGPNPIDDPDNTSGGHFNVRRDLDSRSASKAKRRELSVPQKRADNALCNATTITSTTVVTTTLLSTTTRMLTGVVIVCPQEGTAYESSEFPTLFTTSTVLQTSAKYDVTETATLSTSTTVSASPTTVYAACATNNYADAVTVSNGTVFPIRYTREDIAPTLYDNAYDCCVAGLQDNAAVWIWTTYHGCLFGEDYINGCTPSLNVTAYYGGDGNDDGPNDEHVLGNSGCGKVTSSAPGGKDPIFQQ